VLNSNKEEMRIASDIKPMSDIKDVFKMIDQFHVEYVLTCLDENSTKIKNIKAYITTCLYNSVFTIDNYYDMRVKKDLGLQKRY